MTKDHKQEIESGERFPFGDNWAAFLTQVNENRINEAIDSLKQMLEVENLNNKSFLDIGSGSGIFSLAARRLGATVFSFDYDPQSVACTKELKRRYFQNDNNWTIDTGSVLDVEYLKKLGKFDIVYSWGVLHHTGDMWTALDNIGYNITESGKVFIAIYNYQPFISKYWLFVKRAYNKHSILRPMFVFIHGIYPTLPSILIKIATNKKTPRGMTIMYDLYDWLGGYPFETATPEQIFNFFKNRNYMLTKLKTVGGKLGCNEFVFQRISI